MPSVNGHHVEISDSGTGRAFLWGHGFASSMEQDGAAPILDWKRIAQHARVVRWDAPGHGRSDGTREPDDYRWDRLGASLLSLADVLTIRSFVAGGVSMGAATALHAAVLAPDRVDGLVLALPPTAYDTRAGQAAEYRRGADLVETAGVDAFVRDANAGPAPRILAESGVPFEFVPAVGGALLPAALRGAARSDLPSPERVRTIAAPVLILAWDGDPGHPLSTAERLTALLPHATLVVATRLRDVLAWTDRVATFLDRLPAGPAGR